MNCQQYQDDLKLKAANDEAARETQKMLEVRKKNFVLHSFLSLSPLLSLSLGHGSTR